MNSLRSMLVVLLAAPLLGGCLQTLGGSVAGGDCKAFVRPNYVVLGRAAYDQDWIDQTIESGVGACGWHRPASRPPSLETVRKPVAVAKRKRLIGRIEDKLKTAWPATTPPVLTTPEPPEPPPVVEVAPPPPAPPPPRSKIDRLLHPSER